MTSPDLGQTDGTAHPTDIGKTRESHTKLYRSILQEPTAFLVSSVNDRPDLATVAILGYN